MTAAMSDNIEEIEILSITAAGKGDAQCSGRIWQIHIEPER
jgi:hypothetical protein